MEKIFQNLGQYSKEKALVSSENKSVTYKEILDLSEELVADFKTKEIILINCSYSINLIATYLGCLNKGIVPILVQEDIDSDGLKLLSDLYNVRYIYSERQINLRSFKSSDDKENIYINEKKSTNGALNKDLALLIATSGSTGNPKLVRISHQNIISNANSIISYLGITSRDIQITTLPMNYTFGLSIVHTILLSGGTLILNNHSLLEKGFWNLFEKHKPTFISGVPYTFNILKKLRIFSKDLKNLRAFTQAGGALKDSEVKFFSSESAKRGIDFFVMYGQTEATARMSYLPPNNAESKSRSIGIAIPNGKFLLKNDDGDTIKDPLVEGNIFYKGPNVTLGYANKFSDLNLGDDNKGILDTGDIGYFDEENYFYITGRKKRFIKLFGIRVNLDDVQKFISSEYINCAASGSDDSLIIYLEGKNISHDNDQIKKTLSRHLKINQSAITIKYVDKIPRSSSGKIMYTKLKEI